MKQSSGEPWNTMMQTDEIPIDSADPELAEKLQKEAKAGNAVAQWRLAVGYLHGLFVEKDETQFFHWANLAAEQGHKEGCYYLGLAYADGIGAPRNREEAVKWLVRAAEQDHAKASDCLGQVFMSGEGVLRNPLFAYKWLMWGQLLAKTQTGPETEFYNMVGVLESIEEQLESLKEEMTDSQLMQANSLWNNFLTDKLAKIKNEKLANKKREKE